MTTRTLLTLSLFTFALACGDSTGTGAGGTGAGGTGAGGTGVGGNGGGGAATTGGAGPGGGSGDACEEIVEVILAKCDECPNASPNWTKGLCDGGGGTGGTGGSGGGFGCTAEQLAEAECLTPCYEDAACEALEGTLGPDLDAFNDCLLPCIQ